MSYVEQLERETEQTRSQLAATLNELRSAMTPGQVVDQIADRLGFGDGDAAKLFGNIKRQTVENPLPVALIGAGLAWLAFGGRRDGNGVSWVKDSLGSLGARGWRKPSWRRTEELSDEPVEHGDSSVMEAGTDAASASARSLGAAAQDAREKAGETMDQARRKAAGMADTVKTKAGTAMDKASSAVESVREKTSDGYDALSRGARSTARGLSDSARSARRQTMQTGGMMADFMREQPLVLAGLGLAIGAALGALAPQSDTEEQMLADTGADLKDSLKDKAEAVQDTAQRAVENAMDAAANTAFKGRLKPSGETRGAGARANETTASATDELASSPAQQIARGE